jgi:membrane associated rhomboid family serine protease
MSITLTQFIILIVCATSILAWQRPALLDHWIFNPYRIKTRQQFHRFISSGLIHKDGWHLFFNMLALYFFGDRVELYFGILFPTYGKVLYIALLILGVIVANIPSYLKHLHFSYYNSLGASGGVSAVVFSSILFEPINPICLYFAICLPGFLLGSLFLVYSWYRAKYQADTINHDAHLFGALFGLIFTFVLHPTVLIRFVEQISTYGFF